MPGSLKVLFAAGCTLAVIAKEVSGIGSHPILWSSPFLRFPVRHQAGTETARSLSPGLWSVPIVQ